MCFSFPNEHIYSGLNCEEGGGSRNQHISTQSKELSDSIDSPEDIKKKKEKLNAPQCSHLNPLHHAVAHRGIMDL